MSSTASELQPSKEQDGPKADASSVIRYSREFMLECAKSPFVKRPEALPPTSVWFGEITKEEPELNNGPRKLVSKSSMSERIVLGPPKMSFASSSLPGMKRSDDALSGFKKSMEAPREGRAPRGPPSALEQGFGRETIEKLSSHKLLPKVTPKDITGLLSGMDRRRVDPSRSGAASSGSRQGTTSSGSRIGSTVRVSGQFTPSPSGSLSNNGGGSSITSRSQRSDAPEWMSYNPEAEGVAKEGEGDGEQQLFVDDIQAWKARMKEHERREKEKEAQSQSQQTKVDPKAPSRADSSSSWRSTAPPASATETSDEKKTAGDQKSGSTSLEKPLARTLLSNDPIQDIDIFFSPGGIDLSKQFDSSSAFDKFLSQHTVAASFESSAQSTPARKTDGSRFARFFAEDEPEPAKETEQTAVGAREMPGKQLSLDQLFQAHAPNPSATAPPPLARMPSEAEILESMKPVKIAAPVVRSVSHGQSEDAFAFNKIMAALAKPPVTGADTVTTASPAASQTPAPKSSSNALGFDMSSTNPAKADAALHDPSIVALQPKSTLLDTLRKPATETSATSESLRPASSSTSDISQSHGSGAPTASTSPSTPSSDTTRPVSRPVQVAFGGGIPTSVYRQLSGKSDSQKSASPLIRPLSSVNGSSTNGGGASPSLSSPSMSSPRQFNPQASLPLQQQQQQPSVSQQPPQQQMNRNFGPYGQGPGPALHSPALDPRMGVMYPNGGPSPMGAPAHGLDNEPPAFFNGMPMQRPAQVGPPQFGQQMPPPFSPQMHVSGPSDFMPPHPSQFVGMPPFGAPMHPSMFPMNPVEMLMHRGPGGPPPPRPMPGMGPGPGPNHFVPNNFGHPMNGMPHHGAVYESIF
ncbi:hypothetical protein EC968_004241 [Mortierella alpina]|nr:hypothetical protein EC968_004241 [Mortierella alpina]